jgi:hypothetical protein
MSTAAMTLERLAEFGDAWRGKDLDAVMQFMTDDGEFAAVGRARAGRHVHRPRRRMRLRHQLRHSTTRHRPACQRARKRQAKRTSFIESPRVA